MSPDDPLRETLRNLPRERARNGFTERVLARLDLPEERPPGRRGALVLAAAAAAVVIAALLTLPTHLDHPKAGARSSPTSAGLEDLEARLARLRAERRALAAEVRSLHRWRPEDGVVYLGGDDDLDLVLALEPTPGAASPRPAATRRPVRP